MLRDLRITTAPVEARTASENVTMLGELRVNEDGYAEVGSPITARVLRVLASPGETVRPGYVLAELQSVELGKARAEYLAAKARRDLAQHSVQRKRNLAVERIVPQRELQEAEAEASVAEATLRAARAALQALGAAADDFDASGDADTSRFPLRSPIGGTIIERNVALGQVADPARPLFRIADLARLWLIVHAFERDAVRVKVGTATECDLFRSAWAHLLRHGEPGGQPGGPQLSHHLCPHRTDEPSRTVAPGHVGDRLRAA